MDRVRFKINGNTYSVGSEVASTMMLVDYLRGTLELCGTKYMCREGGCGACIVAVTKRKGGPVVAVNSCLIPITLCNDWEVMTIEHLGNRKKGYHILQKTLAEYNGTQCGYCSPAWIMNMYSFLQRETKPSKLEIEHAFGSNVCRCTGYRPILDALKTFSKEEQINTIPDIEELTICTKSGAICKQKCEDDDDDDEWCILDTKDLKVDNFVKIDLKDGKVWYSVNNLIDIFKILKTVDNENYMLVNGNTAKGVYPILEPRTLIDITSVEELRHCKLDQNLIIGTGITITELQNLLNKTAESDENFKYLMKFVEHINDLGHIPLRNQASVGGNLMMKHQHETFASDLFLLFETVGAYVNILSSDMQFKKYSMQEFLKINMTGEILVHVLLPPLSDKHKLVTFKVAARFQNCNSIVVKAGFLYKLIDNKRVEEARIVFGELSPGSYRAMCTENFLIGKLIFDNTTLQSALGILDSEIELKDQPPNFSLEYRRKLILSLFYKGLLSLSPCDLISSKYRSGSKKIHSTRPVSTAKQVFDTNASLWPLNQPLPKIEGLIQCAGETEYVDDMPQKRNEVNAAFVLSTVATGNILKIDANKALSYPGVLAFYTASDIPGLNSFTPAGTMMYDSNEEILCSGAIQFYNQPLGIIVAETQAIANIATKMVSITYINTDVSIVINLKEAIKDPKRLTLTSSRDAKERGTDVVKTIKGENTIFGQYHFAMENISCISRPTEEGLQIFATTQWVEGIRWMTSRALLIPANHIDVYLRRLGGAFGIKVSRANQVAVACSLVTHKLNRSCRFVLPLTDTMRVMGKRMGCHTQFDCAVSNKGVIQYLDYKVYEDNGYKLNETLSVLFVEMHNNCYNNASWNFQLYDAITDNAKTTFCRAPGTLEAVAMTELMMERISYELLLDPLEVRLANLDTTKYKGLKKVVEDLKQSASYDERRTNVNYFNSTNRWTKRGLRVSLLRWKPFGTTRFDINLSICHEDGTVIITHAGVEMGQGINTKSVQICAYYFKIPIEKVQIKGNSTTLAPSTFQSGGSLTSQNTSIGIRKACLEMLKRLEPIRKKMNNPTWEELIKQAYNDDINLNVIKYIGIKQISQNEYDIFGAAFAEVKVDILTGETEILRVDLVQDVGQSVNPEIDIGQVEGAFIMGQGYWTSENLVYDSKLGELLTDRTWFYLVPLASDIPQDFRISLRKKSYSFQEIMGAKASGEPPICLSVVIALAIREAIASARQDVGIPTSEWFQLDGPMTVEKIRLATQCNSSDFKLQ